MEHNSIDELLEQRVRLLHKLADSLQRAQAALLSPDYDQVPAQTKVQQDLCHELRRLALIRPSGSATGRAASVEVREKALASEFQALHRQVTDLNRKYAALLRRAQRTVNIFCRVLQNSGLTYVVPAVSPVPGLQDWRR